MLRKLSIGLWHRLAIICAFAVKNAIKHCTASCAILTHHGYLVGMTNKGNIRHNPVLVGIALAVMVMIVVVCVVVLENKPDSTTPTPNSPSAILTLEQIQEKFEPLRQQYIQQRGKGEFDKLIKLSSQLVDQYPDFAPGQLFVGQLYFDKGDLKKAQQYIETSLKLDPKQGSVHLLAGNLALMQKDTKRAADHLTQAVALEPSNAQYWLYLGQCFFTQELWGEAQDCFTKALELDSNMTLAINGLADCQIKRGELSKAVFTLQRAIDQTPLGKRTSLVVYLRKQAKILSIMEKPNEALVVLGKLTRTERIQPQVTAEMATYWDQLGEPDKAAELYEKQLSQDMRNWQLAVHAARWWIKAGNKAKAQQQLLHLRLINSDLPVIGELQKELSEGE